GSALRQPAPAALRPASPRRGRQHALEAVHHAQRPGRLPDRRALLPERRPRQHHQREGQRRRLLLQVTSARRAPRRRRRRPHASPRALSRPRLARRLLLASVLESVLRIDPTRSRHWTLGGVRRILVSPLPSAPGSREDPTEGFHLSGEILCRQPRGKPPHDMTPSAKKSVLIVDDDGLIRTMFDRF